MPLIIHTADIHLDSPLAGLPEYEGAPHDAVHLATRRAVCVRQPTSTHALFLGLSFPREVSRSLLHTLETHVRGEGTHPAPAVTNATAPRLVHRDCRLAHQPDWREVPQ